jgi:DHA3 family macrolide efflux protein-like MFS transporter
MKQAGGLKLSPTKDNHMAYKLTRLNGMQKFTLIWFGQLISLFGTATTRFALLIWAYEQTGQATTLALLGFFSYFLYILVSPVAGVLIDRMDRRLVMILADLGAGLMTLMLLLLYTGGGLQIWHLYLAEALTGAFEAFQLPAYTAATTMLVPKEQYGRISGMRSLATSASQVFAPVLAGLILRVVGIGGVMLIDIGTFLVGVLPLIFITIPRPVSTETEKNTKRRMRDDVQFGFRYILTRPGLTGLLVIYLFINLIAALTWFGVLTPMVLARTGGDEIALGSVQSAMGLGGVVGGLLVSVWGGPKRKIHGILLMGGISFLCSDLLLGIGRVTPVWMFAVFAGSLFIPFIMGCDRAIWQIKVAPEVQGRVFAVQTMFQQATIPLGYLLAGPLADHVFGPAMLSGGALANTFGWLVGTGAGAGMGLMFVCTCILGTMVCFGGYLFPAVRNVETDLPDHDAAVEPKRGMVKNIVTETGL